MEDRKKHLIEIGVKCQQKRYLNKKSQSYVAKKLGLSQQTISQFENGKIDSYTIYKIYCELFNGGCQI